MRVLITSFGTRGDLAPFVRLAQALVQAGHTATVCGPPEYAGLATGVGADFVPAGDPYPALMAALEASPAHIAALMARQVPAQFDALEPLVLEADAVVSGSLEFATPTLCEHHAVPRRTVLLSPVMVPSQAHPMPVIPAYGLPRWLNRLSWRLSDLATGSTMLKPVAAERRTRGLPRAGRASAHVCGTHTWLPFPASLALLEAPLWGELTQLTPWILDDPSPLPPAVEDFLASGPPPLFFGLGSMPGPDHWPDLFTQAARTLGHRALIATAAPTDLGGGDVLAVSTPLDHGALFPRCALVAHHGGAGTFLRVARAARPQLLLPRIADQHFHAWRVRELGLGAVLSRKRVTADALRGAIEAALGTEPTALQVHAAQGADGAEQAVGLLEGLPK